MVQNICGATIIASYYVQPKLLQVPVGRESP